MTSWSSVVDFLDTDREEFKKFLHLWSQEKILEKELFIKNLRKPINDSDDEDGEDLISEDSVTSEEFATESVE